VYCSCKCDVARIIEFLFAMKFKYIVCCSGGCTAIEISVIWSHLLDLVKEMQIRDKRLFIECVKY
jgi:hypothetical protein